MQRGFVSKRMLSYFHPPPLDAPIRCSRRIPPCLIPSYIGEENQVLNLLMHHGAGTLIRDYSGYGNHGTLAGPTWTDESLAGWALRFDGLTNIISVPDSASLNLTNAVTEVAWIYLLAIPIITPRIFVKDTGTGTGTYGVNMSVTREIVLQMAGLGRVVSLGIISLNTWTSIATTWDSTSQLPRVYFNGALDNTGAVWAGPIPTNALPLLIGNTDGLNRGFPGIIALPSIYNVDKGANWVRRYYQFTRPMFYP